MTFTEIYEKLEQLGTAQNRKVYKKHGASDNMFGVSIANLKELKKQCGTNHDLAIELWNTGNMDAQCLATLLADAKQMSYETALQWTRDSSFYSQTDLLVSNLLIKTSYSQILLEDLIRTDHEWQERAGWKILALLAIKNIGLPDAYFIPYLHFIEQKIHLGKNRVREAMNGALISIACRNDNLESISLTIADTIGVVEVDHGSTSCKTPDARQYILKVKSKKL